MKVTAVDIIRIRKPKTRYPVIEPIANRFSPRHFSREKISEKDLNSIFEAARLAPSGHNSQPWYFYWTRNTDKTFEKIISCLPKSNYWAKTAAVFIVACYLPAIGGEQNPYALYDLGAAVISLILQAQHLGFYARQIGNCDTIKLKELLNLDKNHNPFVVIALGKIGDYSQIEDVYLKKDFQLHIRKTEIAKKI
jgi:nitroreductase